MKALQQIIRRVAENPSQPWALATLDLSNPESELARGAAAKSAPAKIIAALI
jgi:hypothetical protein